MSKYPVKNMSHQKVWKKLKFFAIFHQDLNMPFSSTIRRLVGVFRSKKGNYFLGRNTERGKLIPVHSGWNDRSRSGHFCVRICYLFLKPHFALTPQNRFCLYYKLASIVSRYSVKYSYMGKAVFWYSESFGNYSVKQRKCHMPGLCRSP